MSASYSREVLDELVTLHARVLVRMPVVQVLLLAGLALVIATEVPPALFLGWCALTFGIELCRALYAGRLLRADHFDPYHEHRRMVALSLCAGAADGLAGALFFPMLPLLDQAMIGIVLFAIPAAGVAVSMSSRYIAGAFSLAVIVPATLAWGVLHSTQMLTVLGLGALYCGLLIAVAVESERLLLRSVLIRHERDRMVVDLERRNADVREAVERAEQAAQSRARVLAAASHDLRQPLHALSVYSAILAADPEPATLREVGSNIDQIVRSLGHLLHGLLDLSRLAASHYVAERQLFALDRLLEDVCTEHQSAALGKGLVLRHALTPATLRSDAMAIARIARNLLDNAIKYTESGEVLLALRLDGDEAVVSVTDTGRGIPPEDVPRVFEEFYQVGNQSRDRSQGVGLGLAIVKRLTELMGGSITLTSRHGEGTRFELRIPGLEAAPDMPALQPAQVDVEPLPSTGGRVFIVDDEADILASMTMLLHLWGLEVHTAADGSQADALFARLGVPDLLITDLRLRGDEHGAGLAARLERMHGVFQTVIITGETSSQALIEAQAAGHAVLQKPVDAQLLRLAVHTALTENAAVAV